MKQPYVTGTSAQVIALDGWSRGFKLQQTIDELRHMGYSTPMYIVSIYWNKLDAAYTNRKRLDTIKLGE